MTTPAACPPWCQVQHDANSIDRTHLADIGPFTGPGQVFIRYVQGDDGIRRRPAFARLSYLVDGEPRGLEIRPVDAHDWANVIRGLDIRSLTEFADALTKVFDQLDEGQ